MRSTHNEVNPQHLTTRGHQIRDDNHKQLDTEQHRPAESQPLANVRGVKEEREDCGQACRGAHTNVSTRADARRACYWFDARMRTAEQGEQHGRENDDECVKETAALQSESHDQCLNSRRR